MTHDLVIRGGVVIDGAGGPGALADVGVVGDRIVEVGRIRDRGRAEIDADGRVVTPGFIDGHTHMDAQVFWDPLGTSSCWHGVTSVVMGNCGFTLAPARPDERGLVLANLERAEDISLDVIEQGVDWTWESFGGYVDALRRLPKGINCGPQVGHSALRVWAMGARAFEEQAGEDDLAAMDVALREALAAGALGLTTTRSANHETRDDRPVASRWAAWSEVQALVSTLAEVGAGVYQYADEPAASSYDAAERDEYFRRVGDLAVATDVPFVCGLNPVRPRVDHLIALIDETARRGGAMYGLTHSRGISVLLSFRTTLPFDRLPEWRRLRDLPIADQARALRDPAVRDRLTQAAREGAYGRAIGAEVGAPDYDALLVMTSGLPPYESVATVAARRRVHPAEAMIDLALESDMDQLFIQPLGAYDEESVVRTMKHPRTVMTFSDSGAHVSQISDCSIHTHLLGYWVRERQLFTLEEAIRMITWQAARIWGLTDRGLVRPGMFADLNVVDPAAVAPRLPEVVHDLPGGARRLVQHADGIAATVVNGQITLVDGQHTGALAGQVLTSMGHDASRRDTTRRHTVRRAR